MLYGHYLSYRVAHAPYSVFGASPLDTSDEEDLALLLLADAEEEATGQKKRMIWIQQHFQMRPTLGEIP